MINMKNIFALLTLFIFTTLSAQKEEQVEVIDLSMVQNYDSKTYDLYYKQSWFESDSSIRASIYMAKHEIPQLSDEEIIEFMGRIPTAFPLTFNNVVKQHIEQFSEKRRLLVSQSLGLGETYFPIFEEKLAKYGMPEALKYLPIIESNMNPFAVSGAGAAGMWQFMPRTGKSLGLDQNDYYDERRDIIRSTEAAVEYLQDLYNIYGDWLLALAAYNCGPGNVNKAIAKAGGKTKFWEIQAYLPKETRDYVPKFTACLFVMHYHEFYEILPQKPIAEFFMTDTVIVDNKISLKYISELTGIDSAYLQFVNPALKSGIVPKTDEGFPLNIPIEYLGQFAGLKDFMYSDPYLAEITAEVVEIIVPEYTVYKVKSGDTLGHIAERHGVGVSQIKKWNSLKSDNLKIGQKIILYI